MNTNAYTHTVEAVKVSSHQSEGPHLPALAQTDGQELLGGMCTVRFGTSAFRKESGDKPEKGRMRGC